MIRSTNPEIVWRHARAVHPGEPPEVGWMGRSVFDGLFYSGTKEQLAAAGVPEGYALWAASMLAPDDMPGYPHIYRAWFGKPAKKRGRK